MRARRARPASSGRPTRSCGCADRSSRRSSAAHGPAREVPGARLALALAQRAIFAHEQLQVRALFVRELEKDLLALGVLEALAVALEELVRPALAPDPDEQRLQIVHALAQLLGALGKQSARRALEEEKRRPRFELRITGRELLIPSFQRAQVLLLFGGELL